MNKRSFTGLFPKFNLIILLSEICISFQILKKTNLLKRQYINLQYSLTPTDYKYLLRLFKETETEELRSTEFGKGDYFGEEIVNQLLKNVIQLNNNKKNIHDIPLNSEKQELIIIGDLKKLEDFNFILDENGDPSKNKKILLMGNYMNGDDKGLLLFFKIILLNLLYPNDFYIQRGNLEIAEHDGDFKAAIENLYGKGNNVYDNIKKFYASLPIGHRINKKVISFHGGIPTKQEMTLDDINDLNRNVEIPKGTLLQIIKNQPSKEKGEFKFDKNDTRNFLKLNKPLAYLLSGTDKNVAFREKHNTKIFLVNSVSSLNPEGKPNYGGIIRITNKNGRDMVIDGMKFCSNKKYVEKVKYTHLDFHYDKLAVYMEEK